MGRKRQYARQEGLVPLYIVERLYESQQSACRERTQPGQKRLQMSRYRPPYDGRGKRFSMRRVNHCCSTFE